jgi:cytochrome c peroxidase
MLVRIPGAADRKYLLILTYLALVSVGRAAVVSPGPPIESAAPAGPFHVEGTRIIDARGRPFLIHGTQLPIFSRESTSLGDAPDREFGPYSASSFATIRHRFNLNMVRIPLSLLEYETDPEYLARLAAAVRQANQLQLLVILGPLSPNSSASRAEFWKRCAGVFRGYPNVMFDIISMDEEQFVRSAGAKQPLVIRDRDGTGDANAIYETFPPSEARGPAAGWDARLRPLARWRPVLVSGWDPELDRDSPSCRALPSDPGLAEELIDEKLRYFDQQQISWMASEYRPGKLITEFIRQEATTLENGWTCGDPGPEPAGIGTVVQFHLWRGKLRGLFAVNAAGGMVLPRGGLAFVYGPILAERDAQAAGRAEQAVLAGVSLDVADRSGILRRAGLRSVSAGWGQINFVVPADLAVGPARITLRRTDGSSLTANTTIVNVAPSLWTTLNNSRGPATAFVTQIAASGSSRTFPAFRGVGWESWTAPIELPPGTDSTIRLRASGLRNARAEDVQVTIGGVPAPVTSIEPAGDPGIDDLVVRLPQQLRGRGSVDVICFAGGAVSNVARANFSERPAITPFPENKAAVLARPPAPGGAMQNPKARLGRYLFYDTRMSVNGRQSCATCHRQELAFTDGQPVAIGATGQAHTRNAPSLVNLAYSSVFTWNNPNLHTLEEQALVPMFSERPLELGTTSEFLKIARADAVYRSLFAAAFPAEPALFTVSNIAKALAAFERTIVSNRSPYDRYRYYGDQGAISDAAKRGEVLFFSDPISCFRCHSGFNFSDSAFHNTGLYNVRALLSYPAPNFGIYEYTRRPADVGKFKTPTLRNIALTAPYMHDGSIATLSGVLDHYRSGGRSILDGPNAGVGHDNPNKDRLVQGFSVTAQNRADLLAFLESLTDQDLLHDPQLSNPW